MAVQLVGLDAADAVELGELLEFLAGWLAREGDALAGSLACFVGNAGYDIEDLGPTCRGSRFCSAAKTASDCLTERDVEGASGSRGRGASGRLASTRGFLGWRRRGERILGSSRVSGVLSGDGAGLRV
jgi:hypothetical protein